MNRSFRFLLAAAVCATVVGCGHRPTGYQTVEETITTRGGFAGILENGVFHDVLYNPESVALTFPGYIVGLDKGRHHDVGKDAVYPALDESEEAGLRRVKRRMKDEPKLHYVSHIVRNEGKAFGEGNCVLYSIYSDWGAASQGALAGDAPGIPCNGGPLQVGEHASAQAQSWKALASFRDEIRRAVAGKSGTSAYSHVVLVVMGWNTPQIEAVRNFNAIAAQIKHASGSAQFAPLFVGVTWPSVWTAQWLDPAIKLVSYRAKANDADEVGTIWISQVADILQEAAPKNAQLVAIGHSFGARALFSAVCSRNVWGKTSATNRKWDTVIGWQPAFSINRFAEGGSGDGFEYGQACLDRAETIILTASEHDAAVDNAIWADMIGSYASWKSVCPPDSAAKKKLLSEPNCIFADQVTATSVSQVPIARGRINYLDASMIVHFNQPNTGGGAHSDIYRSVHGRLNWHAMDSKLSTRQQVQGSASAQD